jgi:hypothetical protein
MNTMFRRSKDREQTAWLLIAVLLGLVLVFCYLFQQRISRLHPEFRAPAEGALDCSLPEPHSIIQMASIVPE